MNAAAYHAAYDERRRAAFHAVALLESIVDRGALNGYQLQRGMEILADFAAADAKMREAEAAPHNG